MKNLKRIIKILILIIIIFSLNIFAYAVETPTIYSPSVILMESETGKN